MELLVFGLLFGVVLGVVLADVWSVQPLQRKLARVEQTAALEPRRWTSRPTRSPW